MKTAFGLVLFALLCFTSVSSQEVHCNPFFLANYIVNPNDCIIPNGTLSYCTKPLVYCTEYNSLTPGHCCGSLVDTTLQAQTMAKLHPETFYGMSGCGTSLKGMFCSWSCGPKSNDVITTAFVGSIPNITIYVDVDAANELWDTCKDRCLSVGGGRTVEQEYGNAVAFVQAFSSTSDASYIPSSTNPYVNYVVGTHPQTGLNLNSTDIGILPPSGKDADGCPESPAENAAISLQVSAVLLAFALFLMF